MIRIDKFSLGTGQMTMVVSMFSVTHVENSAPLKFKELNYKKNYIKFRNFEYESGI